jgi:hypothetical protein
MPGIGARDPYLAGWGECGCVVEAGGLQEFNERHLGPTNRYRRSTFATEPSLHRAPACSLDTVILRFSRSELQPVGRYDQCCRESAPACALTIAAMANELNQRLLAALVPHLSTRTSSRKCHCLLHLSIASCHGRTGSRFSVVSYRACECRARVESPRSTRTPPASRSRRKRRRVSEIRKARPRPGAVTKKSSQRRPRIPQVCSASLLLPWSACETRLPVFHGSSQRRAVPCSRARSFRYRRPYY